MELVKLVLQESTLLPIERVLICHLLLDETSSVLTQRELAHKIQLKYKTLERAVQRLHKMRVLQKTYQGSRHVGYEVDLQIHKWKLTKSDRRNK